MRPVAASVNVKTAAYVFVGALVILSSLYFYQWREQELVTGDALGKPGVHINWGQERADSYAPYRRAGSQAIGEGWYDGPASGDPASQTPRQDLEPQRERTNFLIFFSGHQGSSVLADMLGSLADVYIPGFEPLEVMDATREDKMEFMERTFNLPNSEEDFEEWRIAMKELGRRGGLRLSPLKKLRYQDIDQAEASGFKIRPYDGKRTGFRDLDMAEVKQVLDRRNVSIILTTRYNSIKAAVSWYRARENGLNQFTLSASAETADQKIVFDMPKFEKWLRFVEETDRRLLEAIAYFRRPTLTIDYEHLEMDLETAVKQASDFLGLNETSVPQASKRFTKTGTDNLRKMISNFEEFCEFFWQTSYRSMLGVEACSSSPRSLDSAGSASAASWQGHQDLNSSLLDHLVVHPNSSNPKDCYTSGWSDVDVCPQLLHESKLAAVLRARRKESPVFFKHVHKAGGTTLCSVASENVLVDRSSLPHVKNWNTNCVPMAAFLNRPPRTLVTNALVKLQSVGPEDLLAHESIDGSIDSSIDGSTTWLGGACFYGHLSVGGQHAIPATFPDLGFIASEGPMPDELAMDVAYPLVTMLRKPMDRVLSSYKWWKFMVHRFPANTGSICSTYKVVDDQGNTNYNASLWEWVQSYPDNWVTRSLLGARYLYNHSKHPLKPSHVVEAKNRLQAFSAVLVLEEFERSMELMERVFEWPNVDKHKARNVNPGGPSSAEDELKRGLAMHNGSDGGPRLIEEILERNLYDMEVYEYGKKLFWQHLDQLNISVA